MKIRTFIVDDEPLARLNLSTLLESEPDFDVAGQYGDGRSAAAAIAELRPDLVFLDVQMPDLNGLDVADGLPAGACPMIVFVTAFDRYAVQAFEAQALDYLLKPFRRERFAMTLDRVRQRLATPGAGTSAPWPHYVDRAPDRIAVKCGDRVVFILLDELTYVRAAANYVQLYVTDGTYDVREKISTMELLLPADRFLRVHRSYVVNLAAVRELYPVGGGDYMIALRNGKQLPVGPTYPSAIRRALASGRLTCLGGRGVLPGTDP